MPEADAAAPYLETYRSGRNELDSKSLGNFGIAIPKNLVIKPLFGTSGDCGKSQSILQSIQIFLLVLTDLLV